jgi:hypothetical protein
VPKVYALACLAEALLAGDPYAGLLHSIGGEPVHEAGPPTEPPSHADDRQSKGRHRRDRGETRHEEPVHQLPPPLPAVHKQPEPKPEPKMEPPADNASFGAGIDLWGDDLPPPFVRGADGVIELPTGTIAASGTQAGDLVRFE